MTESIRFDPSSDEVRVAVDRYLKEGGKIESARDQARMEIKEEIRNQLIRSGETDSAKVSVKS